MRHRILYAGILALGTGMSWGDTGLVAGYAVAAVTTVDVPADRAPADDANERASIALDPSAPNVHLRYAANSVSSDSTLPRGIDFNGVTFPVSRSLGSDIDLTQVDGDVYGELVNDSVALDIGLTLRYLQGGVDLVDTNRGRRAQFDGAVPMLFGRVRMDVWNGVYALAELQAVTVDRDRLSDGNLLIGWDSASGLGIETGYRSYRLKLDDYDQLDRLNVDVSGPYATVKFRF